MTNPVQLTLQLGRRYPQVQKDEQRILALIVAHWKGQAQRQKANLNPVETLEDAATRQGITLAYVDLPPQEVQPHRALYASIKGTMAHSVILLPRRATKAHQAELLAEEMAHHQLNRGNILNQQHLANRKQEKLARDLAYQHILPPEKIAQALAQGYGTPQEIGEYTGLRPLFVQVAMEHYRQKGLLPPSPLPQSSPKEDGYDPCC